jgi:amino acid transporter
MADGGRMLSYFVTAGVLVGFDASGHVAEETKNASLVAARGVFYSALASGLMGFPILILFLFCTPNFDVLFSFDAPQPFVSLYALALGQNAHIAMNVVSILGLLLVCPFLAGLMRILLWRLLRLRGWYLLLRGMECYRGHGGFRVFRKMVNLVMQRPLSGLSVHFFCVRFFRLLWLLHLSSVQLEFPL